MDQSRGHEREEWERVLCRENGRSTANEWAAHRSWYPIGVGSRSPAFGRRRVGMLLPVTEGNNQFSSRKRRNGNSQFLEPCVRLELSWSWSRERVLIEHL